MLIANLIAGFVFAFEIFLYIVLGVNIFSRPQISDSNSLISYEPPKPGYHAPETTTPTTTTTTAAPIAITCNIISGDSSCNACPSGTTGGTIQSPNYPNDFGTPATTTRYCDYRLEASSGKVKMVLKAGANIGYSTNSPRESLLFYDDDGDIGVFPTTFPTTEDMTFTSNGIDATFSFNFDFNACPSAPCKWEMTYSAVA